MFAGDKISKLAFKIQPYMLSQHENNKIKYNIKKCLEIDMKALK